MSDDQPQAQPLRHWQVIIATCDSDSADNPDNPSHTLMTFGPYELRDDADAAAHRLNTDTDLRNTLAPQSVGMAQVRPLWSSIQEI